MTTDIRRIKGAKSLRYEVVYNGTVHARVIALPLAERVAKIVEATGIAAEAAIASLLEGAQE